MSSIKILPDEREGQEVFKKFDIVDYSKKTFGMFGGKEESIMFEAANDLAGVFIDRFGTDIFLMQNPKNPKTFLVRVPVNVSPQFYGWVFGLGKMARIVGPEDVRQGYLDMMKDVQERYE